MSTRGVRSARTCWSDRRSPRPSRLPSISKRTVQVLGHALVGHALVVREGRAQHLVAPHDLAHGALQGRDVERAAQPADDPHVVGRDPRLELVHEPDALLGVGQGQAAAARNDVDRRQRCRSPRRRLRGEQRHELLLARAELAADLGRQGPLGGLDLELAALGREPDAEPAQVRQELGGLHALAPRRGRTGVMGTRPPIEWSLFWITSGSSGGLAASPAPAPAPPQHGGANGPAGERQGRFSAAL